MGAEPPCVPERSSTAARCERILGRMKAAFEHDNDTSVESPRRRDDERQGAEHHDPAADTRALAAVGAGRVGSLDHAGARSLQRMAGNAAFGAAVQRRAEAEDGTLDGSSVHDVVGKGGGSSLDPTTQGSMESAFGHDFSSVRVHSDGAAQSSAKSVQARAYTVGDDIVLGEGVSPGSSEGQRTLAHELTHVVQQRSGPVAGVQQEGGVSVSTPDDHFEQEAERNADTVMGGGAAQVASATAGPGPAAVQAEHDHDHDVQTESLQRADVEGGEEETEDPGKSAQAMSLQRAETAELEGEEGE